MPAQLNIELTGNTERDIYALKAALTTFSTDITVDLYEIENNMSITKNSAASSFSTAMGYIGNMAREIENIKKELEEIKKGAAN